MHKLVAVSLFTISFNAVIMILLTLPDLTNHWHPTTCHLVAANVKQSGCCVNDEQSCNNDFAEPGSCTCKKPTTCYFCSLDLLVTVPGTNATIDFVQLDRKKGVATSPDVPNEFCGLWGGRVGEAVACWMDPRSTVLMMGARIALENNLTTLTVVILAMVPATTVLTCCVILTVQKRHSTLIRERATYDKRLLNVNADRGLVQSGAHPGPFAVVLTLQKNSCLSPELHPFLSTVMTGEDYAKVHQAYNSAVPPPQRVLPVVCGCVLLFEATQVCVLFICSFYLPYRVRGDEATYTLMLGLLFMWQCWNLVPCIEITSRSSTRDEAIRLSAVNKAYPALRWSHVHEVEGDGEEAHVIVKLQACALGSAPILYRVPVDLGRRLADRNSFPPLLRDLVSPPRYHELVDSIRIAGTHTRNREITYVSFWFLISTLCVIIPACGIAGGDVYTGFADHRQGPTRSRALWVGGIANIVALFAMVLSVLYFALTNPKRKRITDPFATENDNMKVSATYSEKHLCISVEFMEGDPEVPNDQDHSSNGLDAASDAQSSTSNEDVVNLHRNE